MRICVDIDNVINDLTAKTLVFHYGRSGVDISMDDITAYNFYDCLTKENADKITASFKEKELWDSLKPLPGSQEGLKKLLKQGHQIYLATATDPINFEWKCMWLKQYFSFIPTDNIIRIMDKSLLKCDVLVDDCLTHLISSFSERICLDYPWNQSTSKDYSYDIKRAYNWNDIVKLINDIERKDAEWDK